MEINYILQLIHTVPYLKINYVIEEKALVSSSLDGNKGRPAKPSILLLRRRWHLDISH